MAPGFFKKIGNFFKRVWDGTKKVFKKVAPVVKQVVPFLAPLIPGGAMIAPAISTGLGIAEKFADGDVGGGIKDIGTNITSLRRRSTANSHPHTRIQDILKQNRSQPGAKAFAPTLPPLNSPRIKLR